MVVSPPRGRSFRRSSVDASHEGTIHSRRSPGGSCTPSRLDEVGVDVRLRARLTNLADEDVDSAEGDPVPILN